MSRLPVRRVRGAARCATEPAVASRGIGGGAGQAAERQAFTPGVAVATPASVAASAAASGALLLFHEPWRMLRLSAN